MNNKRNKVLFGLFSILFLTVGTLVSCGESINLPTHGASTVWKYDDTNHWHPCIDANCEEKIWK